MSKVKSQLLAAFQSGKQDALKGYSKPEYELRSPISKAAVKGWFEGALEHIHLPKTQQFLFVTHGVNSWARVKENAIAALNSSGFSYRQSCIIADTYRVAYINRKPITHSVNINFRTNDANY